MSSELVLSGIGELPLAFAAEMLVKLHRSIAFNVLVPSSADDHLLTFAAEIMLELSSCVSVQCASIIRFRLQNDSARR